MSTFPRLARWLTALHSMTMASVPLIALNKLIHQKGSTIRLYLAGIFPMMLTADPDFIQHILQKNQKKYQKSDKHFDKIKYFWGQGLLTSEGNYWKKQRKMVQSGFHKKRLMVIVELMNRITDDFIEKLDKEITQQSEVDMLDKMHGLTFRVIANTIFGADLKEIEFQKIKHALPTIQRFIIRMIRQPYLNWWFKWSGQIKVHEKLRDAETEIIRSYIQKRRKSNSNHDDLLQMLLDVRYEDGSGMTDEQLIEEINVLFIAGHETSSNALSWIWYLLSQHPIVLKKLRTEVNSILPEEKISFQHLNQLVYTQQIIEEALRLFPPAWATSRVAIEDDEFKGVPIKKGTIISAFIYGAHHSPDLWDNPEAFQPERFSVEKKKRLHPYAFIPFGGGKRMCVGRQFALMEMKLILAKMVQKYKIQLVENQTVEFLPLLNLQPKYGIKVKLEKREKWVRTLLCAC